MTDICARKNGGNVQSREAHAKVSKHSEADRLLVLQMISEWAAGLSMKECAQLMGRQLHQISGRGSELKRLRLVEPTGIVRDGSMVLRVTPLGERHLAGKTVTAVPAATGLFRQPTPDKRPADTDAEPLSPVEVAKEWDALTHLYVKTPLLSSDEYEAAKTILTRRMVAWFAL